MRVSMRLKGDFIRLVYDSEVVPSWWWVNYKDARLLKRCVRWQTDLSTEAGNPVFLVLRKTKKIFAFAEPRIVIEVNEDGKVVDES